MQSNAVTASLQACLIYFLQHLTQAVKSNAASLLDPLQLLSHAVSTAVFTALVVVFFASLKKDKKLCFLIVISTVTSSCDGVVFFLLLLTTAAHLLLTYSLCFQSSRCVFSIDCVVFCEAGF